MKRKKKEWKPSSVKVGHLDFNIHWAANNVLDARWGDADYGNRHINLDVTMPPWKMVEVFNHELDHILWKFMGLEDLDKEERIVESMNNARTMVRRDNPKLFKWLDNLGK